MSSVPAREAYEWLIGMRYLRSGHRRGFLSFITGISIAGLALGVAVLLIVMSVMNGFENELRTRILNVTSHATLEGDPGPLANWRQARQQALELPGVTAAVPYIGSSAMVTAGERLRVAGLRGIDPGEERALGGLAGVMRKGRIEELAAGQWQVILGSQLATELGVDVGDTVLIAVPKGVVTPLGLKPRTRRFTVSGVFESGMYEYDAGLALLHIRDAARLLQMGDAMTGVRLQLADALADPAAADRVVRQLGEQLGGSYLISDWTRVHANLFRSIQMTKSMLFVILSMIVAIAAFNIVATLVMVVKEKEGDIAILRTLGAGPANILRVFGVQGACIGIAGIGAGIGLGVLVAVNLEWLIHGLEKLTGMRFLDAKVYLMSDLPGEVRLHDIWKVALVSLLLCLLATVYPAWRGARVQPAEALRHD
jgi:lipoprotein-releasing system permease protein